MKYLLALLMCIYFPAVMFAQPYDGLVNIMGIWNRTRLSGMSIEEETKNYYDNLFNRKYFTLEEDGNIYAGFLNSLRIMKYGKNLNFSISCDGGQDYITKSYYKNDILILEVRYGDKYREETQAKIGVNFISNDIIFFTLIEGETYSFIDYGPEFLYIRAPLIKQSSAAGITSR